MVTNKIHIKEIKRPEIMLTERASQQLKLIEDNDYTIKSLHLRILISGKECDGFTYSVGFTEKRPDDLIVPLLGHHCKRDVLMGPFSAQYIPRATLDFIQDFSQDAEGFVVINAHQKEHHGKFWNKDSS